jgi:hypothetical protein
MLNRRVFLRGVGGAVLGLPALEAFSSRRAYAQEAPPPFAIFFRQANGVAQAHRNGELGEEPERFWPRSLGALTAASLEGRALGELAAHASDLLVVRNVNKAGFNYGDGHATGVLQGLTAQGPVVENVGGQSEANGESIDHRIGRELNPDGRDSLVLYAGRNGGWLGGACQSYRGPGVRRSAINNPWNAYQAIVGGETGLSPEAQQRLVARQESINDLVRGQLNALLGRSSLSSADRDRLDLHLTSVRELEVALTCRMNEDTERALEDLAPGFDSTEGDEVLETTRLHMDVAALAVACGATRAVSIQVGSGNDGSTRYRNLDTGAYMENFHYISHRRLSHGADGQIIDGSDVLHHMVDVQFARTFRHLLERLSAYEVPGGGTLLQTGVAVWHNDSANGPPHGRWNVPHILAGSAGGYFRQGVAVEVESGSREPNHHKLLNSIGAAVGLTNGAGEPLDDFGDASLPRGRLTEIEA